MDTIDNVIYSGEFGLRCIIKGTGSPVLVVGSALYYSRIFSQELCKSFQLIFADHRGFAAIRPSHIEKSDFELEILINDIELLRKSLGLEQIDIVGHSGHGYIVLEYAKRYPHNVNKVVIIAMSPDSSAESFNAANQYFHESVCPERKQLLAQNIQDLPATINADPGRAFITRMLKFGPMIWYQYDFDATYLWQDIVVIPAMFDYVWGEVFKTLDITKGLTDLQIPVFVGLGRYDYWNPPYLWERVRSQFAHLTLRVFEHSGHTPPLEEAQLFDHELQQFLLQKISLNKE